jgi:hypothetical protein
MDVQTHVLHVRVRVLVRALGGGLMPVPIRAPIRAMPVPIRALGACVGPNVSPRTSQEQGGIGLLAVAPVM